MFPRFTIRVALLCVTLAALFSVVVARAVRGDAWAAGVAFGVGSVALALLCHAMWYVVVRAFSGTVDRLDAGGSPRDASPGARPSENAQ